MDKLRALQYFVAAAEEKSFSGAARRLEVSVPAISKLVNTLEKSLGARLFVRAASGLSLTADGATYLDACLPALDQISAADDSMTNPALRPKGRLVIGAMAQVAQQCLVPALPKFHLSYPYIELDFRVVNRVCELDASAVDLFVLLGWPNLPRLVHKVVAQTRQLTCAAPAYWASNGVPARPSDLARHTCFPFRNSEGTVIDVWRYLRDDVEESVVVRGWLTSNHRDVNLDLVLAGEGVARVSDIFAQAELKSGRLVPVLSEWEMMDSPPVNLFYSGSQRRNPRVKVFIDFVSKLFAGLEAERDKAVNLKMAERPEWYSRRFGHASMARSVRSRK
ncbi:MAG: LysR family transcriptional regulator [Rhodocyclaceae bacterium]|nr:LysR family transcriptional regulator [Rhodocyclaceae bacterium]